MTLRRFVWHVLVWLWKAQSISGLNPKPESWTLDSTAELNQRGNVNP
jgi:hypothetical protein